MFNNKLYICFITLLIISLPGCKHDTGEVETEPIVSAQDTIQSAQKRLLSFLSRQDSAYVLPWSLLTNVSMIDTTDALSGMDVSLPVFNDTLLALNGKQVILEGFYIPVEETKDEKIVILSAFPFAQCFFCGKAGIESIVDILTKDKLPNLKTDTKIRFSGRLRLNRDDFDYLIYILDDAKYLGLSDK
jgi:hypothetical protein